MTTTFKKADHSKRAFIQIIRPIEEAEPIADLTPYQIESVKNILKEQLANILLNNKRVDKPVNQPTLKQLKAEGWKMVGIKAAYFYTAPIEGNWQPSTPHERSRAWAHQTDST